MDLSADREIPVELSQNIHILLPIVPAEDDAVCHGKEHAVVVPVVLMEMQTVLIRITALRTQDFRQAVMIPLIMIPVAEDMIGNLSLRFVYVQQQSPGQQIFGVLAVTDQKDCPLFLLQSQMNRAARMLHRIYSEAYGADAPGWEQLTEFQRQSNIAAAGHLLTKLRILLEDDTICCITVDNCRAAYERYRSCSDAQKEAFRLIEHRRWMRFHSMYNWSYAPVRNNSAREHPLMLPYGDLTPEEQAKDDFAWELLNRLAGQTENN